MLPEWVSRGTIHGYRVTIKYTVTKIYLYDYFFKLRLILIFSNIFFKILYIIYVKTVHLCHIYI